MEAIARIDRYTAPLDKAAFLADEMVQDAVIRNFEIIGEACNNVVRHHPEFAAAHSDVPWGFAYEMRNALAHGYFKVDLEIVWQTIQADLPGLASRIGQLAQN
ncbi:MAG: DUF86 domain-containing protein [Zoogloeaceae bacterium]|nr:DUF86 domain-containing protein [Zoogloeaceae bacterium]